MQPHHHQAVPERWRHARWNAWGYAWWLPRSWCCSRRWILRPNHWGGRL